MNTQQVVSIVLKLGLLASGALLALGMITPEQQAALNQALQGVTESLVVVGSGILVIYQIARSIKTHK